MGINNTVIFGCNDGAIYAVDQTTGTLRWKYMTGGIVQSSPVVAGDGTVYVGSEDHNIYALTANGQLLWKYATGGVLDYPVALLIDNSVCAGSADGTVYDLDPRTGALRWKYATVAGAYLSAPAVAIDGTIYF